jgi:hypothetical protein
VLLLTSTTDKIQVITGQAASVDIHASWIDYTATPSSVPGRLNTAGVVTATTTDAAGSPGASTQRNVKTLNVRNKHGSVSVDITVVHTDGTTAVELVKMTLLPGDTLEYVEGVGFYKVASTPNPLGQNANTADVVANAADTYLTGSGIALFGRIKAGSFIKYRLRATKTGAGVATPIFSIRVGTAGSTSDTARTTHTLAAQTAVTDTAWWELDVDVLNYSASGVIRSHLNANHLLATTGFATSQLQDQTADSATFDLTAAGLILGVSVNPGAAGVWTFQKVLADSGNSR